MKKWDDPFRNSLYTYNPKRNGVPDKIELSNNLSLLTNFVLNVFINSFDRKNLITAIPETILRPIPIISYLYAYLKNKSVIVFTQKGGRSVHEDPVTIHNRNYQLLNVGDYLFYDIPIGIISKDTVKSKIYLPRAKRDVKKRYLEQQKKNFSSSNNPKILLCYEKDNSRIAKTIDKVVLDDGNLEGLNVPIKVGLVIFENTDRFVYSPYTAQLFIKWISPLLDEKVNFFFHFSNPMSKYILTLKEKTNSLTMHLGPSLLRNNEKLKNESLEYFKTLERPKIPFLNKYNYDRPYIYEKNPPIQVKTIYSGNIDTYFKNSGNIISKVDETKIQNKIIYNMMKKLLYELYNLVINPSKYKKPYKDEKVGWKRYKIPQLIQKFKENLHEESKDNRILLNDLLSELSSMYSELKECKRYKEEKVYSRTGKDYKLLEILNKLLSENEKNILIATFSSSERNILEKETFNFKDGFEIKTISQINNSTENNSNKVLILPGPLRIKYLSEILQPYKKIIMLAYSGINERISQKQVDDLSQKYSFEQEKSSMSYLGEIYELLNVPKDGLFKDYYKRMEGKKDKLVREKLKTIEKKDMMEKKDVYSKIKEFVHKNPKYKDYLRYEEEISQIDNKIKEFEQIDTEKVESKRSYNVTLKKINDSSIQKKTLPAEKTYLYLKEETKDVKEGTPRNLRPGYFVIILDDNERKTLLDLILEIFDLEESIDKNLIEIWKKGLMEFIENYNLSFSDLFDLYKKNGGKRDYQTVRNWARGNVLSPDDPNDLFIIGKILSDEELMEDYINIDREAKIMRSLHQSTGRKIRKIIKEILQGELNPADLSYEEYMLYEKIKEGVYELIEIKKPSKYEVDK